MERVINYEFEDKGSQIIRPFQIPHWQDPRGTPTWIARISYTVCGLSTQEPTHRLQGQS